MTRLPLFVAGLWFLSISAARAAVVVVSLGGTLTINSDTNSDSVVLGVSNGFFHVVANGQVEPISGQVALSAIDTIIMNGNDGDDVLTLTHDGGLITSTNGITFNGGAGQDMLALYGDPGIPPLGRETYMTGPALGQGASDGLVVFDPNDSLGPALFGVFDGDEERVQFTGLAPVLDAVPSPLLEIWLTPGDDNAHLEEGASLDGAAALELNDGGSATFESIRFAMKQEVLVSGTSGADSFTLDATTPSAGLTVLGLYGHDATAGAIQPDDDAADQLAVLTSPPGLVTSWFGQGGDDVTTLGDASNRLDSVGPVAIDGGDGQDQVALHDAGQASAQSYLLASNEVSRAGGWSVEVSEIEQLTLQAGSAADLVQVVPAEKIAFHVDGGLSLVGDELTVDAEGLVTTQQVGALYAAGRQAVVPSGFETLRLVHAPADLVLTKRVDPEPVEDGSTVVATLAVSNSGPSVATGVLVTDVLPPAVTFRSSVPPCPFGGGQVNCSFDMVDPGEEVVVTLTLSVEPFATGVLTNSASVALDGTEVQPADNTSAFVSTVQKHVSSDFDGDGLSDFGVLDPASYTWFRLAAGGALPPQPFGAPGFVPVPADYDGDGITDVAVYETASGTWYILQSGNQSLRTQQWGWSEALPVPADYDGDGHADVTVYHPASGTWYIQQSHNGVLYQQQWGWSAALPVPSDFDGDGEADMTVYYPAEGMWYVLQSHNDTLYQQQWGWSEALPVPADYDRDGESDFTVYYPDGGQWFSLGSTSDLTTIRTWGYGGAFPVPGDYDGDQTADIAVYEPATGNWYVRLSSTGATVTQNWGYLLATPLHAGYQLLRLYGLVP